MRENLNVKVKQIFKLTSHFAGQSGITHIDESARYMALIFGRADRETYGNAIGFRLDRYTVSHVAAFFTSDIPCPWFDFDLPLQFP